MDEYMLSATRSWRAVAEPLLAGPQHRDWGTSRLRVVVGGSGRAVRT